ncbi:MAG: 5-(carboxyamino)imidazole ribonucleotide synthase, partial [Granulosicoccaceae bacterium]
IILPGSLLGVMGGGQLGRMFALEAIRQGYMVAVFDPDPESPAGLIAHQHLCADYTDVAALDEFAEACAAVTTEFENVPADSLRRLATLTRVAPGADALEVAQDRRVEKTFFAKAGVETVRWQAVETEADVAPAVAAIGPHSILKTATLGYDGKGQRVCNSEKAVREAFAELGAVACVLEQRIDLAAEISVVAARNDRGEIACYPPGDNVHRNGILHTTVVPAQLTRARLEEAQDCAVRLLEALNYVGVLALEFFIGSDGRMLANEMAPRPHNSGHYTQDACASSQFDQQVRALCNMPLGDTRVQGSAAMLNLLGDAWVDGDPDWPGVLALSHSALHLYGKAEARAGRKMGHINVLAADNVTVREALADVAKVMKIAP